MYVAVDPSSVAEYTGSVAFATTGGGPQSAQQILNNLNSQASTVCVFVTLFTLTGLVVQIFR